MADLTLNFSDASFDVNDDYFINPGNNLIYEMGTTDPLKNGSNQNITATSNVTGAAFTVAHNQHFFFEFEDTGTPLDDNPATPDTGDDYKVNVSTPLIGGGESLNSISFDIGQSDLDGVSGPDSHAALVNGHSAAIAVTRLAQNVGGQSETYTQYVGDGTVANNTSWVLSGDTNGGQLADTGGSFGFQAGHYGGVFLGGAGKDTLVFDHQNPNDTAQMYVDLSSGMALFGNNVGSPLVQFATFPQPNQTYSLTWERLEMMGDSNDFVIVGRGLQQVDSSAAAKALNTADFFQIDLGSGDDELYVTDSSQSILLDLSKTGDHTVSVTSSGKEVTFDIGGFEMDGASRGDAMELDIVGEVDSASNPMSGVIDYIHFGDGQNNTVINQSEQGLAVDFGSSLNLSGTDQAGADKFTGSANTNSDLIDLRGVENVDVSDTFYVFSGSTFTGTEATNAKVEITGNGNVEIEATNVDLLYVSSAGSNGQMNTSDSDVLVNAEHLYGAGKGLFGKDLFDVDYSGYDVVTSAELTSWAGSSSASQIYYDGNHNAFIDTADTLDRKASDWSVNTTGVTTEQEAWSTQIQADTGGSATPSFYILTASDKKVPVYLDVSDPDDKKWKVDINEFEISSDTTISSTTGATGTVKAVKDAAMEAYGITLTDTAIQGAKSVYLNATESDIDDLLTNNEISSTAFDFGFYTQVAGTIPKDGGGTETVFVNIGLTATDADDKDATTTFAINADDVHVQTGYNTVMTDHSMAIGGTGGDFVELGSGTNNIAMGNAGNDTYVVNKDDKGLINELGDLMNSGHGSAEDSIQFQLVEDIADLDFSRGRVAGEADGSTLFIDGGADGQAQLFDQYNSFLSFRKTEYLVLDDGADSSEIFELVTGNAATNTWENEIYVAKDGTDSITVDGGGTDHVFLASGSDTVQIDALSTGDKVFVHDVNSGTGTDTIKVGASTKTVDAGDTLLVLDGGSHASYLDWAEYEAFLASA